eukprot:CAMPEP_0183339264 /NCGR_PEP_ID=MMETSP0164_2-20130417/6245_1 /TAXON_ID=221442 /ORGANISM="Coccolithus pelagicus ssp braarudi, Strain PLY182g" /LENGTH=193 /DNA_ID=CAMNT_0025509229 /DNA_START=241 /DNA_END=818 /DNA_ORIENTATION=+
MPAAGDQKLGGTQRHAPKTPSRKKRLARQIGHSASSAFARSHLPINVERTAKGGAGQTRTRHPSIRARWRLRGLSRSSTHASEKSLCKPHRAEFDLKQLERSRPPKEPWALKLEINRDGLRGAASLEASGRPTSSARSTEIHRGSPSTRPARLRDGGRDGGETMPQSAPSSSSSNLISAASRRPPPTPLSALP